MKIENQPKALATLQAREKSLTRALNKITQVKEDAQVTLFHSEEVSLYPIADPLIRLELRTKRLRAMVTLSNLEKFGDAAVEVINGRLAWLGDVIAPLEEKTEKANLLIRSQRRKARLGLISKETFLISEGLYEAFLETPPPEKKFTSRRDPSQNLSEKNVVLPSTSKINKIQEEKPDSASPRDIKNVSALPVTLTITGIRKSPTKDEMRNWVEQQKELRKAGTKLNLDRVDKTIWDMIEDFDKFIVLEDDDLLIVNKPPGINAMYGSRYAIGVYEIARFLRGEAIRRANRLDKDTSGVMVLTKSVRGLNSMDEQFADKSASDMKKIYLALLQGAFTPNDSVDISIPIANTDTEKMRVVSALEEEKQGLPPSAKPSRTVYTPLYLLNDSMTGFVTLTQVQIFSGRTHQIRVVAEHLGYPVMGDRMYNSRSPFVVPRQMLHAFELTFKHPATLRETTIQAPITDDIKEVIKRMKIVRKLL